MNPITINPAMLEHLEATREEFFNTQFQGNLLKMSMWLAKKRVYVISGTSHPAIPTLKKGLIKGVVRHEIPAFDFFKGLLDSQSIGTIHMPQSMVNYRRVDVLFRVTSISSTWPETLITNYNGGFKPNFAIAFSWTPAQVKKFEDYINTQGLNLKGNIYYDKELVARYSYFCNNSKIKTEKNVAYSFDKPLQFSFAFNVNVVMNKQMIYALPRLQEAICEAMRKGFSKAFNCSMIATDVQITYAAYYDKTFVLRI